MIFQVEYIKGFHVDEFVEEKRKALVQGRTFAEAIEVIEKCEGEELMSISKIIPLTLEDVVLIEDKSVWQSVVKDIKDNAIW